jgi:deoxyribodipyrimidine photo-lyase
VKRSIVWFRRDLRLQDNPAWSAATAESDRVTALFVVDPVLMAGADAFRRDLLWSHLTFLDAGLREIGGRLLVLHGDPVRTVVGLAGELGAQSVHVNADASPYSTRRDQAVRDRLGESFVSWWGNHVQRPGSILTSEGHTPRVFTVFAKHWFSRPLVDVAKGGAASVDDHGGDGLLIPRDTPFQPGGERAAQSRLEQFEKRIERYKGDRDVPSIDGTSQLSADLHFGVLSPASVVSSVRTDSDSRRSFVRQLAWRDWYAHLLWEVPTLTTKSLRPEFDRIRWDNDEAEMAAWRAGQTGFPIVDAGMRQLATTGWMHNRVRMITASFLVKDLLVDWRIGERWFRRLLVDADVAQNVGNWQWVAGTGPDAAPYFRVFNPVLQSRKFDSDGAYIRRFVPELRRLGSRWIHAPWEAPDQVLSEAGITLGDAYPQPIVDHASARIRTLAAYKAAASG